MLHSSPVRQAAINALYNSLEFIEVNFKNEQERNYIMQTVIDAACSPEIDVSAAAFECLVKIMQCYYYYMLAYMNAGLFEVRVFNSTKFSLLFEE
jgi:importin subunit beta-1